MDIPAYIALGANLEDREWNLRQALERLGAHRQIRVEQVSAFHETAAVGGPPKAPPFLNAAARIGTTLSPHDLLAVMLQIEQDLGRIRQIKWEPRLIDLDILLYDDMIISNDELIIPHPLMHERRFVLEPLAEIAPDVTHPTLDLTIAELLGHFDAAS